MCLLGVLSLVLSFSTQADTVHRVHFSNPGKVLVWQDGSFVGQGSDIAIGSAQPRAEEAWYGAGALEPVASAASAETGQIRLKIASNAGFVVEALEPRTANSVSIDVIGQGPNASLAPAISALSDTVLFAQATKTATQRGAPDSQAIEITLRWTGNMPALRVRSAAF